MAFELKHFTPEQLDKLSILNPSLRQDLGMAVSDSSDADLEEAIRLNTEAWLVLEKAINEEAEAYRAYLKAKKGKPLFEKGEILAMLLFFCLLLVLI